MNPRHQANLTASQQYKRDLTKCDPPPPATQLWMCPSCDTLHLNCPITLNQYRCKCGWHGNRDELLVAHYPDEMISFKEAGIKSVEFNGETYRAD